MDFVLLLPIIFFFFASCISLIFTLCFQNSFYFQNITRVLYTLVLLTVFFSLILTGAQISELYHSNSVIELFSGLFLCSAFYATLLFFAFFFFFIFLLATYRYNDKFNLNRGELLFLCALSFCGSYLLIISNSFISIYLSIELQTIPFYILLASRRLIKKSVEAALKYFVLSIFSSSLLLFGFSLVYYVSGLLSLSDLFNFLELGFFPVLLSPSFFKYKIIFFLGLALILCSLLFKLSAAPFHFWTPDIYEGGPSSIILLLSTLPKFSSFVCLINIFYFACNIVQTYWAPVFLLIGLLSLIVGTMGAFYYSKIIKILAFGSTAHIGFLFLSLGSLSSYGVLISFFYIFTYLVASFAFFYIWLNIYKESSFPEFFFDFGGLAILSPSTAALMATVVFSYAGIPPLAGFVAKFFILQSLVSEYYLFFSLFVFLASALSAVYYLRFIKIMFFYPVSEGGGLIRLPTSLQKFFISCLVCLLLFGPICLLWV